MLSVGGVKRIKQQRPSSKLRTATEQMALDRDAPGARTRPQPPPKLPPTKRPRNKKVSRQPTAHTLHATYTISARHPHSLPVEFSLPIFRKFNPTDAHLCNTTARIPHRSPPCRPCGSQTPKVRGARRIGMLQDGILTVGFRNWGRLLLRG